jgi:hypothetical protein
VATAPRSKSVARPFELGFPSRFECILDHGLKRTVANDRDLPSTLPYLPNHLGNR